jgi:hypothetical protein
MNPEGLLSGIARLRSLGLPDDEADPPLLMWSRGKRGLLHLERNCSAISTFSVIRHSHRAGSLPATRLCRRCVEQGLAHNNSLLHQRIHVSRVLKQFEDEQSRCHNFPWRKPLLIRQMKSTISSLEDSNDTTGGHEFRSLLVRHIREIVSSAVAEPGYGQLEQSLMRAVSTEILTRDVRENSRSRDHAVFPPGGVGSLPNLYTTWCQIWAESRDFDSARQGVRYQLGMTTLRSLSQLEFVTSGAPPQELTVGTWVQLAWRDAAVSHSERLMDDWEVQANHELGSPQRIRLLSYSCRHEPDGLLASVTEYYKVATSVRVHVVRVPAVVARWLIEQKRLNLLGSIAIHDAVLGDDVVRTAVTLHEDDNSTYSSLTDAFTAAVLL